MRLCTFKYNVVFYLKINTKANEFKIIKEVA